MQATQTTSKLMDDQERGARIDQICSDLGVNVRRKQKMAHFTSLRVGGEIDAIAYPENRTQAARLVHALNQAGIPWSPLGYGTNLLVKDGPIRRVAVSLRALDDLLVYDGTRVHVHAGYSLPRLVNGCADRGLAGIQGLAPIPGSVGGGVKMNAGSHGYEIADVIESVDVAREGEVLRLKRDEIDFRYRYSPFTHQDLILGTILQLKPGNPADMKEEIKRYKQHRSATQPVRESSAGCIFKNPGSGLTTGRIIDELGMKGVFQGGATISTLHANFIVTDGKATAADIFALIDLIRDRVTTEHGLDLELEVEVWD